MLTSGITNDEMWRKAGMKKNHGMSLISSWFEKEIEQERRTEYRAPSPPFPADGAATTDWKVALGKTVMYYNRVAAGILDYVPVFPARPHFFGIHDIVIQSCPAQGMVQQAEKFFHDIPVGNTEPAHV